MANTIRVTAGEGRTTPIDRGSASAAGNQQLVLRAPQVIEVDPTNPHIVRQLRSGDLVLAPEKSVPAPIGTPVAPTPGKES